MEGSILPYAFGEKGSYDTKDKQIKKIFEWLNIGLDIDFISPRINRVIKGIREMYFDIVYWGFWINSERVINIKLANSDLHNRGLGVLFVTYQIKKNNRHQPKELVTKVIKPEDKSLERELLGTGASLAEELNRTAICVNGEGLLGAVKTLDIQTSRNHGSMVEYFEGEQIDRIDGTEKTESDSKTLTEIFTALTGMDDLHYENLLYQRNSETGSYDTPAMIDADNALSKRIFGNLSEAIERNNGFGARRSERQNIDCVTGIDEDFILRVVKPRFMGKKGRTVPIRTTDLASLKNEYWKNPNLEFIKGETWDIYINYFLYNIKNDERIRLKSDNELRNGWEAYLVNYFLKLLTTGNPADSRTAPGLRGVVGPEDYEMTNEQKSIAVRNALSDFRNGQIPFYEYDFSTGYVLSHGSIIWHGPKLDDIFSGEAVARMIENFQHPGMQVE